MRFLRLLVVPALLVFLAGTASANDLNILIDPTFTVNTVNDTMVGTNPVTVSWGACTPGVGPAQVQNATGCIYLFNTGPTIHSLSLTFTIPTSEPSEDPTAWTGITCTVLDTALPNANCPTTVSLGQTVTLTFEGGNGIPTQTLFEIAEEDPGCTATLPAICPGVNPANMPAFTVMVPTYDPSTLVLLTSGIGLLAIAGLRRYA